MKRRLLFALLLAVLPACASSSGQEPPGAVATHGAWLWWRTLDQYGVERVLDALAESRVRDVFVLVKSISGEVREDHLDALVPAAHARGMRVHAWVASFKDAQWTQSPVEPGNAEYRAYLLGVIDRMLQPRPSGHAVDGIHLDYVRYARDAADRTEHVTSFVAEVRQRLERVAPARILSVASKAEEFTSAAGVAASARFYGQDYAALARHVDLFCPMTYHLDYGVAPAAAMLASSRVAQLTGKPVLAGLQLHAGPDGKSPTVAQVTDGLRAAREAGLQGVAFFRTAMLVERADYRAAVRSVPFPEP